MPKPRKRYCTTFGIILRSLKFEYVIQKLGGKYFFTKLIQVGKKYVQMCFLYTDKKELPEVVPLKNQVLRKNLDYYWKLFVRRNILKQMLLLSSSFMKGRSNSVASDTIKQFLSQTHVHGWLCVCVCVCVCVKREREPNTKQEIASGNSNMWALLRYKYIAITSVPRLTLKEF